MTDQANDSNTTPPATTKPEPWVRYDLESETLMGDLWRTMNERPDGDWIKYAPVEATMEEVKCVLKQLSFAAQITGGTAGRDENLCAAIAEAQRLLANWPVKEDK